MSLNFSGNRAGWLWLFPRIAKHYWPLKKTPRSPSRKVCSAQDAGGDYVELRPRGTRNFEPLPIFPEDAGWLWAKSESVPLAPWFRLKLDNACVWGIQGWVGNEKEELVQDVFSGLAGENWHIASRAIADAEASSEPVRRLTGMSTSLLMPNHTNYFHWLWEGLPRFELLRAARDIDHWIVPPADRAYIKESLAALAIPPEKIVYAGRGVIRCEQLLVASQFASASYLAPAEFPAPFVQKLFVGSREPVSKRIFVVRGNVSARQLINERQVGELLGRYGFVTTSMDGLSIADQAALFSGAEAVIGVHGAALANLIFCEPGTRVIELLPRNWPSPVYGRLAVDLGLRYRSLAGCEPALRWAPIQNLAADLLVDLKQLKHVLSLSGLG